MSDIIPYIKLTREGSFSAAHRLPNYQGACANLHGHTWKVEVTIGGFVQNDGMVFDFKTLAHWLDSYCEMLDHTNLNDRFSNPTAENILVWFRDNLESKFPKHVKLKEISLWESPKSKATLKCV